MASYKKKVFYMLGVIPALLLMVSLPLRAESISNMRYSFSFKTNRSACMARINNAPLLNNFSANSGTVTAGGDITPFAANGKNTLELVMGATDPDQPEMLYADSWCELVVLRNTTKSSEVVSTIKLTVDGNKKIIASSSSNPNGAQNEGAVSDVQSAMDKENDLYGAGREITLSGMPEWAWEKARKISVQDLPAIKETYTKIWQAMNKRDVGALKTMAQISSKEMALATGFSADFIFKSYGLPEKVQDTNLTTAELKWEDKELVTYCDGRLFRLARGIYQNSPLKIINKEGEAVFTYNPYLAIIDGEVVIVR